MAEMTVKQYLTNLEDGLNTELKDNAKALPTNPLKQQHPWSLCTLHRSFMMMLWTTRLLDAATRLCMNSGAIKLPFL